MLQCAPTAADKRWNSPTTLYLARRLHEIAQARAASNGANSVGATQGDVASQSRDRGHLAPPGSDIPSLAVLDMGCGYGTTLELLAGYGYDLHGYDLPGDVEAARTRLRAHLGDAVEDRIRVATGERTIPFEDNAFDVVYASQVFEHVRFLDRMLEECVRVLRPGGILLPNFPLATYPVEWHLKIPMAHWVPPGTVRTRYLWLFYALGLRPRLGDSSAWATAASQDAFLHDRTYYRFMNEVVSVAGHFFDRCEVETGMYIRAKSDLLMASDTPLSRLVGRALRQAEGPVLDFLVTYYFNAAFCITGPRKGAGGDAGSTTA